MQSIFRLPWCTDQVAPKLSDKAALDAMRASPVVSIPGLNKLKRKHTSSPEPFAAAWSNPNKKQRRDSATQGTSPTPPRLSVQLEPKQTTEQTSHSLAPAVPTTPAPQATEPATIPAKDLSTTAPAPAVLPQPVSKPSESQEKVMLDAELSTMQSLTGLTPLQQVIDNEFNMQILLKHNELRLIEQELAKCQVALEQLRRCEIRPYPGSEQPSPLVTSGTGAAVEPQHGYTRPAQPAPYGVTDGPYTRHYRHWLLHDPEFDSIPEYAMAQYDVGTPSGLRSSRNLGTARKPIGKPFHAPTRSVDALHSLPNYPAPPPKDKSSPLVLRRSTDGQLVKLICNNCHRGNFSSIQGFLNHCRIAHKVDYKSHDAAAIDCGQLLDSTEAANLPTETPIPVHKPSAIRTSVSLSTPSANSKNLVHPMNMNGSAAMPTSIPQDVAFGDSSKFASVPKVSQIPSRMVSTPLKGSTQAPRLSAHFAKHNVGGDLEQAIAAAKQKIDLGHEDGASSPDSVTTESPFAQHSGSRTVASAQPATMSTPEPSSRKGQKDYVPRHRPSPLSSASFALAQDHGEIPESPQDHLANLSPNTADSNPGLVSDHEDDDHASGSEDEAPHTGLAHSLGVRRDCSDNMDIDIAVDDGIDEHGVVIRRNSMIAGDERGLKTAPSSSKQHV